MTVFLTGSEPNSLSYLIDLLYFFLFPNTSAFSSFFHPSSQNAVHEPRARFLYPGRPERPKAIGNSVAVQWRHHHPPTVLHQRARKQKYSAISVKLSNFQWFVVGAQSFPLHHRRKCDYLLERATTIMKMLSFRPNISAEHFMVSSSKLFSINNFNFQEDQKILGDLIVEFQTEISVEYKRLYTFLLLVEEQNAFEGFRCLFNLQDVVAKEDDKEADEVRKVNGFIRRRYSWVGSGEQSWLHKATTFYHSWEYIRDPMKNRILQRYR